MLSVAELVLVPVAAVVVMVGITLLVVKDFSRPWAVPLAKAM
jgi:hypothetical protein